MISSLASRHILHDKQLELPEPIQYKDKTVYQRFKPNTKRYLS